ncbi:MAG: ABC transporter substrate-binding protein [Salibacteraceae bacterium]
MLKLGLLLPHSNVYPALSMNFVDGLHLAIDQLPPEQRPEVILEDIGHGGNKDLIIEKAQKMLLQYRVAGILGFVNHYPIEALTQIANTHRKPFLISDLGGSLMPPSDSPFMSFNTGGVWESAYHAGQLLGKAKRKMAVIGAFYDGGFHYPIGFHQGLTQNGGSVVYNLFQGDQPAEGQWDKLPSKLKESEADALFVQLSGNDAKTFFEWLDTHPLPDDIEIWTNPFAVAAAHAESWSAQVPEGIQSVCTWSPELEHAANTAFITDYKEFYGAAPDFLSVIGFENGLIIKHLIEEKILNARPPRGLPAAPISIESPRGGLHFNPEQQHWESNHYLRTSAAHPQGPSSNPVSSTLPELENITTLRSNSQNRPVTGWYSTYLC